MLFLIAVIKNRKFQHIFLLVASYFFFYFSSNILLSLLIFSTLLDFYIGKEIWKSASIKRKKILLIISLTGNLALLGFFKYANFTISQFNILGNYFDLSKDLPLLDLALPIGISFYTFQTISYTVDIYRGHLKPSKSLREFALFVSFFPQLVAGPIVRAKVFLPQLREVINNQNVGNKLRQIRIERSNLKLGVTLMTFGFLKKMFFADGLNPFVSSILDSPIGLDSFTIFLGTIAYGIQIYCDFSGYSDIAIGAALIIGIKLPKNFNKPYFANSFSDFWKRWHISLSTWLRDYLYIPLGGNRKSSGRIYFNILTVMVIGGLWHGASWNFVIWGILHGSYLVLEKLLENKLPVPVRKFFKSTIGKIISVLITQYFVFLAWIPFRVQNKEAIVYAMQKYVFFDFNFQSIPEFFLSMKIIYIGLMVGFICLSYLSFRKNLLERISILTTKYWIIFVGSVMVLILFTYTGSADFIYFRF